jgi:hypothetical protein
MNVDTRVPEKQRQMPTGKQYEELSRIRLSKNFILRDFLFSTECAARGFTNYPEDVDAVVQAGKLLCDKVLEPVLEKWGRFWITFGYMSREGIEDGWSVDEREANPHGSSPHQWDRKTWGDEVYARVDILPICIVDEEVTKHEFGHWLMHNLDIDLLMQWGYSKGSCITISPKPRRVWLEWGKPSLGQPQRTDYMATDYWKRIYPTLSESERPKFGPSHTGGSLQWPRGCR